MAYCAAVIIDAIGDDRPAALDLALDHMGIMLEALIKIDVTILRRYLDQFPPLYSSGVVYGEPNIVVCDGVDDNWIDISTLYLRKRGTCKELCAARIAELRVRYGVSGTSPFVTMEEDPDGKDQYHVLVRWPERRPALGYPSTVERETFKDPEGREFSALIECPSSILGMGADGRSLYDENAA
jgi:hypothetical protein